jgi:hypothetical protein
MAAYRIALRVLTQTVIAALQSFERACYSILRFVNGTSLYDLRTGPCLGYLGGLCIRQYHVVVVLEP